MRKIYLAGGLAVAGAALSVVGLQVLLAAHARREARQVAPIVVAAVLDVDRAENGRPNGFRRVAVESVQVYPDSPGLLRAQVTLREDGYSEAVQGDGSWIRMRVYEKRSLYLCTVRRMAEGWHPSRPRVTATLRQRKRDRVERHDSPSARPRRRGAETI